ncbi:hypothetical protein ACTFIU_004676 [Dictyostelium citrinum]
MDYIISFFKNVFGIITVKKVMILGVENVGKTTLLYNICKVYSENENNNSIKNITSTQLPSSSSSPSLLIPTNGFNVESIIIDQIKYDIWDIGGKETNRICYRHYLTSDIDSIIFVFDSSDINSLEESKKEYQYLKNQINLKNVPFLLVANKQDLKQKQYQSQTEIDEILKIYFGNSSTNETILMSHNNNDGLYNSSNSNSNRNSKIILAIVILTIWLEMDNSECPYQKKVEITDLQ